MPRRASIAARIADERGWTIGREVGWQIRFEQRFTPETRLLVATEGILTARLQQDPLLSGFRTIVLDEFHERSIHADLGIALAKQAWRARDDLRLVVMSATLDAERVPPFSTLARRESPGPPVPARRVLRPGIVACADGRRDAQRSLRRRAVLPARGLRDPEAIAELRSQPAGLSKSCRSTERSTPRAGSRAADSGGAGAPHHRRNQHRRTSVTVPGVSAVVDSGLHKVARYDAARAIDSLTTERITADAADQRAGRAGALRRASCVGCGTRVIGCAPHREPDVHRIDLSSTMLDILAWGGHPRPSNGSSRRWVTRSRRRSACWNAWTLFAMAS